MKIAVFAQSYLPRIGGAEVHAQQVSRWMMKNGVDVKIFTPEVGAKEDDIPLKRINCDIESYWNFFQGFREIDRDIRGYDLIYSYYSHKLSLLAGIAGRLRKKPVILSLQGLGTILHPELSPIARLLERLTRYFSLKIATVVVAPSEEIAVIARNFLPASRVYSIPNGVDTRYFSPVKPVFSLQKKLGIKKGEIVVMTLRRLVPKNGVQFLIDAVPDILKMTIKVKFCIVGDGRLRPTLEKKIKMFGIQKEVMLAGEANRSEVRAFLSISDIVVFPSSAEATSLAASEAMSMGKAIVASKVGGFIEMIGENDRGVLVDLFSRSGSNYEPPDSLSLDKRKLLAKTIANLAVNKKERQRLGRAARTYMVDKYDWTVIGRQFLDLFKKTLENN